MKNKKQKQGDLNNDNIVLGIIAVAAINDIGRGLRVDQNDAFAEMVNGGGAKGIATGFEGPIVVIGSDPLEGEVVNAVTAQNGREASDSVSVSLRVVRNWRIGWKVRMLEF